MRGSERLLEGSLTTVRNLTISGYGCELIVSLSEDLLPEGHSLPEGHPFIVSLTTGDGQTINSRKFADLESAILHYWKLILCICTDLDQP